MAGYISNETIDAILSVTDIVSVVGEYTRLERRGGNDWWGCCPLHGEKTASFHVDGDKKFYHCFGCNKGGNVINFIMEMEKTSYVDTITALAKKNNIEIKYKDGSKPSEDYKKNNEVEQYIELYERTASMFHYMLLETEQGKHALDYITSRGITKETIEKFKLGYSPSDRRWLKGFLRKKNFSDAFLAKSGLFSKKYPDVAFFSDRLMFPIFDRRGQVVAFGGRILHPQGPEDRKYLNSGELIQYKKRETLFAFNFAKKAMRETKSVIFCEGYMDCIAYHQCGIEYAVAPLGTALTEEQVKIIQGFVDTVYLSFDSDNAGQNATLRAILMCRQHDLTVKVIRLKGGKDPAEIMLNFGKENLTVQVKNAILDSDYLLSRLGEKYPVDIPEGKAKAALEYFQYIDVLQSDIQKESCLEQLSQTFNLKPEAVKRDFNNRKQAHERTNIRLNNNHTENGTQIKVDAELRGLVAVASDLDQFKLLREELNEVDFQNPSARKLFSILEECYDAKTFTIKDILAHCSEQEYARLITESISSGVYQGNTAGAVVQDTIKYVKRNRLDAQRNNLLQRIREYTVVTEEDQKQFNALLEKKMQLDKQIQNLGK
ncbi:MAG: DNA primase [Treponema sp.]|nr:DNA primase [Treponema sp.]